MNSNLSWIFLELKSFKIRVSLRTVQEQNHSLSILSGRSFKLKFDSRFGETYPLNSYDGYQVRLSLVLTEEISLKCMYYTLVCRMHRHEPDHPQFASVVSQSKQCTSFLAEMFAMPIIELLRMARRLHWRVSNY